MSAPVNCLKMINSTVIVAGLANGQIFAWDLSNNQCNFIPMSNVEITALQIFQSYLIVGDANGVIKVFNCGDLSLLMEGRVQ